MANTSRTSKKNRTPESSSKESKRKDDSNCVIEGCSDYAMNSIGIIMNLERCKAYVVCDKHYTELMERYYHDERRVIKQKMDEILVP